MITQKQEVLNRIQSEGGITRAQAANMYIFELSARIHELKTQGDDLYVKTKGKEGSRWIFQKTPVHGKRPGGRPWRVIRYSHPMRLGV